jgi:hypothetical protein
MKRGKTMIATAPKPTNRCEQLDRLLTLAELLRQFRFPISTATIRKELELRTGRCWSKQTLLRDLRLLALRRYVDPVPPASRGESARWRWRGVLSLVEQRPHAG